MYVRILSVLALGLLIFVAEQRSLYAQFGITPSQPQQQQQHPCQAEFTRLRDDLQAKGKALQDAGKRKAAPKELCARVTSYSNVEGRLLNFFEKKSAECGIPAEAAASLKKNRTKTAELRTRICNAAANPGPAAAPPSAGLSGALGPNTGVIPETPSGGGIFDTLSGNVLQQ